MELKISEDIGIELTEDGWEQFNLRFEVNDRQFGCKLRPTPTGLIFSEMRTWLKPAELLEFASMLSIFEREIIRMANQLIADRPHDDGVPMFLGPKELHPVASAN